MAFRLLVYMTRIMQMHLETYPKDDLPLIYPLVVYSNEKVWDAPTDIFELFGKEESTARELFLKPFHLIDLHRIDDNDIKKNLWSGVIELALKYKDIRKITNYYLDLLFPSISELEIQGGSHIGQYVVDYTLNNIQADDIIILIQKADKYLSEELKGKIMTFAEAFKKQGAEEGLQAGIQEGVQQGLEKGVHLGIEKVAINMIEKGHQDPEISELTGLSLEKIRKLRKQH